MKKKNADEILQDFPFREISKVAHSDESCRKVAKVLKKCEALKDNDFGIIL